VREQLRPIAPELASFASVDWGLGLKAYLGGRLSRRWVQATGGRVMG